MTNTTISGTRFECYACGRDLTPLVTAAVFGGREPVVQFTRNAWPKRWRVVVTCPTGEVQNVFGAGNREDVPVVKDVPVVQKVDDPGPVIVTGRPPTASDRFWTTALEKISVEDSLARIDALSKHLFTIYAVVTTLLTGVGIVTGTVFDAADFRWILLPLTPLAISLALAVASITPQFGTLNPADLTTVRDYYEPMLRRRGRLIFLSGLTFALSVLLTVPAFWMIHRGAAKFTTTPVVVLSKGDDGFTLAVKVDVSGLAEGSEVEVRASAGEEELLRTRGLSPQSGTVAVDVTIPVASMDKDVVVSVIANRIEQEFTIIRQRALEVKDDANKDSSSTTTAKTKNATTKKTTPKSATKMK